MKVVKRKAPLFFKIFFSGLLLLFFLFSSLFLFLHTEKGRELLLSSILSFAQEGGFSFTTEKTEGNPPSHFLFSNLTIDYLGQKKASVEAFECELSLFSLFKKELRFSSLQATKITFFSETGERLPHTLNLRGTLSLRKNRLQGKFEGNWSDFSPFTCKGKLVIKNELLQGKFSLFTSDIATLFPFQKLPLKGTLSCSLEAKTSLSEKNVQLSFPIQGTLSGKFSPHIPKDLAPLQTPIRFSFPFSLEKDFSLIFSKGLFSHSLFSSSLEATFGPSFAFQKALMVAEIPKLHLLVPALPSGLLKASFLFTSTSDHQLELETTLFSPQLLWKWGEVNEFQGLSKLAIASEGWKGSWDASFSSFEEKWKLLGFCEQKMGEDLSIPKVELSSPFFSMQGNLSIKERKEKDLFFWEGPFSLSLENKKKLPFSFLSQGNWFFKENILKVEFPKIEGKIKNHSFALTKVAKLLLAKDHVSLEDFLLESENASLQLAGDLSPSFSKIEALGIHLPLDLLFLQDLSFSGTLSGKLSLLQEKDSVKGTLECATEEASLLILGNPLFLPIEGSLQASLAGNEASYALQGFLQKKKVLKFTGTLPLQLNLFPFSFHFDKDKPFSSLFSFEGRIEPFVDFFNLGPHRLEGELFCALELSQTLHSPKIFGSCEYKNGLYENYYTGTYLEDIVAKVQCKDQEIVLESITAKGSLGGTFLAKGKASFNPEKLFPFSIEATFSDLACIQLDLIEAKATGSVTLAGNQKEAFASGKVHIDRAEISIPNKLPIIVPELPVQIGKALASSHPLVEPKLPFLYPLHLEIEIAAPQGLFIRGRGLNSEWKGNFFLSGTYSDLLPKGSLELLKGDFTFSGRPFSLKEGLLSFTGKSHEMPQLALSAYTIQRDVTITASLFGPLNAPSLYFQSMPSLPLSGILSLLIFGRDISEISGLQALQLVSTVASLSDGPDFLEATRKNLGIDRLTLTSKPSSDPEKPDTVALEIGKYITKEVLVSFSQGVEFGSSNFIVEVDLKQGLVFQAETQQQEEQGKFTLKWVHYY